MIAKELQDWFPEAQISDQPIEKPGYLTLPLAAQGIKLLDTKDGVRWTRD